MRRVVTSKLEVSRILRLRLIVVIARKWRNWRRTQSLLPRWLLLRLLLMGVWRWRWVTGWVKRWRWRVRWEGIFVLELSFLILAPLFLQNFLFLFQERKINENSNINSAEMVALLWEWFWLLCHIMLKFVSLDVTFSEGISLMSFLLLCNWISDPDVSQTNRMTLTSDSNCTLLFY